MIRGKRELHLAFYFPDFQLIVREIVVRLYPCAHLIKAFAFLKQYIHQSGMAAASDRYGYGCGVFDSANGPGRDGMPH